MMDKYNVIGSFNDGFVLVRAEVNDELDIYGYINEEGYEVVPLKYDYAKRFKEGLAEIVIGDKFGFIDKHLNEYFFVDGKSVGSEGCVVYYIKYEDVIVFKIVSYLPILTISRFFGTKENIIKDIRKVHGENQYAKEYIDCIEEIEKELLMK